MTRPLVYVSGPITADPIGCIRPAIQMARTLRDAGCVPYLPQLSVLHEMFDPQSWDEWIADDLVILGRCDGLVRLPGLSADADREVDHARQCNIPVWCVLTGAGTATTWATWLARMFAGQPERYPPPDVPATATPDPTSRFGSGETLSSIR